MFVVGDDSKFNNSDFEPSQIGDIAGPQIGRSGSIVIDNALDKNRYLIDNFEVLETVAIGSLS